MSGDRVYLRPDVQVEPLVGGMHAWLHSIAPVPGALLLAGSHLPTLRAFVKAPEVHVAALQNPAMRGGAFVALPVDRRADVESAIDALESGRAPALALAEAISALDRLLAAEATGTSLEPLYEQIPPALRGYVELTYDRRHRAGYRLLEALLYRGSAYDESRQSVDIAIATDDRPFILTTPRLPRYGHVLVDTPLASPALSALLAAELAPAPYDDLVEGLGLPGGDAFVRSLFVSERDPVPTRAHEEPTLRVRYLGHASLCMEAGGMTVLVDPFLSANTSDPGRFTYSDLPDRIDYCLVTHGHQDHFVLECLLRLRNRVQTFVVPGAVTGAVQDPSPLLCLRRLGFDVIGLDELEEIPIPGGRIVAFPFLGEHADLAISAKLTYLVELGGRAMYVAIDSSGIDPEMYSRIRSILGRPIDTLYVGMECDGAPLTWLYGSLFTEPVARSVSQSRRLNGSDADQAWEMAQRLGVSEAYVYGLGEEPWLQYVMATNYTPDSRPLVETQRFVDRCREAGIESDRLFGAREWRYG